MNHLSWFQVLNGKNQKESAAPTAGNSASTIGAGDLLKRLTQRIHIHTCDGCKRRAEALNKVMRFRTGCDEVSLPNRNPQFGTQNPPLLLDILCQVVIASVLAFEKLTA
jgi:hypothetical protein